MLRFTIGLLCAMIQPFAADKPAGSTSLVESELSFAKRCQEVGVRASFMEFFAEDGIAFKPEPFRYKEFVKGLPSQPNPKAIQLEWEPQTVGIAASGDLGYSTGPSVRTDLTAKDKPRSYGQFFSVWKKQNDGRWKVAVDIGTQTPTQSSPLGRPCREPNSGRPNPASENSSEADQRLAMTKLEHEFEALCASDGVLNAYLSRTEADTRLHRENHLPIVGRSAIEAYLDKESFVPSWSPMGSDVSVAGDLGYTYGSYSLKKSNDAESVEKGYYLHVWKQNARGEWKLVADVVNPESSEKRK